MVRSAILVLAVLVTTWDDLLRGRIGGVAWLFLGLLVAGSVYGALSWLRTKYWVESDELRVDTGVLSRQSRRIRVDRLQGIDIVQPFAARLLGLAELKLDVAGGSSGEGSLAYLRLADAERLRDTLLSRRDLALATRDGTAVPAGPSAGSVALPGPAAPGTAGHGSRAFPPERVLARLDLGTLLLSLLLSVETLVFAGLVLMGAVVFVVSGHLTGVAAGALPVLAGFVLTQFRKLSAYYGFTVSLALTPAGAALRVRRGLFERSSQTVTVARVQGVVVSDPWLWRRPGWARLDVSVAGYGSGSEEDGPSASTVLPVAPRAQVTWLARILLAGDPAGQRAGERDAQNRGLDGPDRPGTEGAPPEQGPDPDAVGLTATPRRARFATPWWRVLAGGVGSHLVVSREGVLVRRTHVVAHAKVQSTQLRQGPWQRRLGLADVQVDTPPGAVKVRLRHRGVAEARVLLDELNAAAARARVPAGRPPNGPGSLAGS